MGGVATGLVDHVGQHVGAECREPLAGDRVFAQPLGKGFVSSLEFFGIRRRAHLHSIVIKDDGLEPFGPHHGADASPPGMTGGALLHVGDGDRSGGHFHLTGLADGDAGDFFAVLGGELVYRRIIAKPLEIGGRFDLDAVFVDKDLVLAVIRHFALEDNGRVA